MDSLQIARMTVGPVRLVDTSETNKEMCRLHEDAATAREAEMIVAGGNEQPPDAQVEGELKKTNE